MTVLLSSFAGFANMVLSWKPFQPLGRLTYCAYLVHFTLQKVKMATVDREIFVNESAIVSVPAISALYSSRPSRSFPGCHQPLFSASDAAWIHVYPFYVQGYASPAQQQY